MKLNTVFTKTLLWFFGTVILTFAAVTIATALNFNSGERRPGPLASLLRIELSEARYAYETGGVERLRRTMERFERITEAEGIPHRQQRSQSVDR